jgi:hypothetical protein
MIGRFAEQTMMARQNGVPIQKILDAAATADAVPMRKGLRALAIQAWDQPRYVTKEMQDRAISEFRDQTQVSCMQRGG